MIVLGFVEMGSWVMGLEGIDDDLVVEQRMGCEVSLVLEGSWVFVVDLVVSLVSAVGLEESLVVGQGRVSFYRRQVMMDGDRSCQVTWDAFDLEDHADLVGCHEGFDQVVVGVV